jgi:hypothetical protein
MYYLGRDIESLFLFFLFFLLGNEWAARSSSRRMPPVALNIWRRSREREKKGKHPAEPTRSIDLFFFFSSLFWSVRCALFVIWWSPTSLGSLFSV